MQVKLKILYFANLREQLGKSSEEVELPASVRTVGALREHLIARGNAALSGKKLLRMAVNQEMVNAAAPIKAGDEVAFFPPVTGG